MKNIFEGHCYGSTWGITVFYDDCEALLRQAVESGGDFLAEWGAKKEITYATVERGGDITYVEVRTSIDELSNLIDTAVWWAFGGNEFAPSGFDAICKLHDIDPSKDAEKAMAIMEEVEDGVRDIYFGDFIASEDLPRSATFEDIVACLNKLEDTVSTDGQKCYDDIVEYIQIWWDAIQEQADMDTGRYA